MFKKILFVLIISVQFSGYSQSSDKKWFDSSLSFETRIDLLVSEMTLDEKIAQLLNQSPEIKRLDVPEYNWWNEALHGVARNGKATVFPQAIGLAATFDTNLSYEVANAIAD